MTELSPTARYEGIPAVAKALSKSEKIISVKMQGNAIGDQGVVIMAAAALNSRIESLNLGANNIGAPGGAGPHSMDYNPTRSP